jgi:hypothetical protein
MITEHEPPIVNVLVLRGGAGRCGRAGCHRLLQPEPATRSSFTPVSQRQFRIITATGYFLSVAATAMHLCEGLLPGAHLHKWALWMITLGFGALTMQTVYRRLHNSREVAPKLYPLTANAARLQTTHGIPRGLGLARYA